MGFSRTITRRIGLAVFLALTAMLLAPPASATPPASEAETFVQTLADEALAALKSGDTGPALEGKLAEILDEGFDLTYIGRLALGPTYRSLTDAQRSAYDEAFRIYVLKTYSRRLSGFSGEKFNVVSAAPAGSRDIKVKTELEQPNEPTMVIDWRVRERDVGLRIIDVEIEGISMAISQRSEFAAVVEQQGVDGLITLLKERSGSPA